MVFSFSNNFSVETQVGRQVWLFPFLWFGTHQLGDSSSKEKDNFLLACRLVAINDNSDEEAGYSSLRDIHSLHESRVDRKRPPEDVVGKLHARWCAESL